MKDQSIYSGTLALNVLLIILVLDVRGDPSCPPSTYGDACDKNCSEHCGVFPGENIVYCAKTSGRCSEGCEPGWYDATCNKECSTTCINNTCNHRDGMCTRGCKDGKKGNFCEEEGHAIQAKKGEAKQWWLIVAGATTLGVVILILILICAWHIHKCLQTPNADQQDKVTGEESQACMKECEQQAYITEGCDQQWRTTQSHMGLYQGPVIETPLHRASAGGDLGLVKQIVSEGEINVNTRGFYGLTPLMLAAQEGHHDVFRYLHSKGADMTLTDCHGDHFLSMACVGGNLDIVEYVVLKQPTLINRQRNDGRTSLMWAAWHGKKPVFGYLLNKGADPSLMDQQDDNILHYACHQGQIDIVKDIITNTKIDFDSGDICGKTALTMAAEAGHTDIFDLLVRIGCKTSHTDGNGNNILHLACRGGHVKMVEYILSRKDIDINCRGQYGETPLMMAAFYGHRDVYDLLCEKGADAELVDNKRNNILHVACMEGHVEIVKDILSRGLVDINSHGQNGRTPLMLAAWMERSEVSVLLLHEISDLLQVDHEGNNILHLACEKGCKEIVQKVLLQNSLDINERNGHGETASMVAKHKHHMELYELLVSW